MTQALIGANDWQEQTNWSGDALLNGNQNASIAGTVLGTFLVSAWLGLAVRISSNGIDVQLVFDYFADSGLTIPVAERDITQSAFANIATTLTLPNLSNYVRITAFAGSNTPNAAAVTVVPTNRVGPTIVTRGDSNIIEATNQTVLAGNSVTLDAAYTYTGPCHVSILCGLATGSWRLQWVDISGSAHLLARQNFPLTSGSGFYSPLYLPPEHIEFRVDNTTGASGAFSCYIIPDAYRTYS